MVAFTVHSYSMEKAFSRRGNPVGKAELRLPMVTGESKAAKRINRQYKHLGDSLLDYAERRLSKSIEEDMGDSCGFTPFSLVSDYRVTENTEDVLSLYLDITLKCSFAKTQLLRFGGTWDTHSGFPLPMDHFFGKSQNYKKALIENANRLIIGSAAPEYDAIYAEYPRLLRRHFSRDNFYIRENRLCLFYLPGTLAAYDVGILVFPCEILQKDNI